jgi:hypothetical protein
VTALLRRALHPAAAAAALAALAALWGASVFWAGVWVLAHWAAGAWHTPRTTNREDQE